MALIGYRSWVVRDDGLLRSCWFPLVWDRPYQRAECLVRTGLAADESRLDVLVRQIRSRTSHVAPDPSCNGHGTTGCGIYVALDVDRAFYWAGAAGTHRSTVVGRVVLWGRVMPHEHGYRAQHCRIDALVAGDGVGEVAGRYGLPVLTREEMEDDERCRRAVDR